MTETHIAHVELERQRQFDAKRQARRRGHPKLGDYFASLLEEYAEGPVPTPPERVVRDERDLLATKVELTEDVWRRARLRAVREGKYLSQVVDELVERDTREAAQ